MRVGAHLRTPGGLRTAIENARAVGADVVQLFLSNPRAWAAPRLDTAERFGTDWREAGVGPLYVHAPYLVNIASPNPGFHAKSLELVARSVAACEVAGAAGFVVHAGAGGPGEPADARGRAASLLRSALELVDGTSLIVELMAGTSGAVASNFGEARALFDAVGDGRLRLCVDTCHLFATGYGLDDAEGVAACFTDLHDQGLAERLTLVHANDAKHPRASHRDRHERIGEGLIGLDGFAEILHRPEVRPLDLVLETPADPEQRARELATLRRLAG
ncbi:MAG TPA: deoxyribonuclease IV [Actinomycetota bacterium]|nr:deoxyribonuclease IV [Actinomycetota bacterium]